MTIKRDEAAALDVSDPLAGYRDRFVIDDDALVYLDGNSLGRLPKASRERVRQVLEDDWGRNLIKSWEERWLDLPVRIGDLIASSLLGADAGEVIVNDSTTVALYKSISAALDARPGRRTVVIEEDNFPTDRYVVEALAQHRGLEVRWIPEAGPDGVTADALADALSGDVAVTVLSHVDYRSAAIVDMAALTQLAHQAGALTVWDLCHSVGAVPIDLHADGVDIAVGCTYKYLNGGPGAPSFTFVRRDFQPTLHHPIWGWWSRREMFEMAAGYEPHVDMRAWLTGTPGVLSMAAVEPGVRMVAEAGVAAIRRKSRALTELASVLYDDWLAPRGWAFASPRDTDRRGSHVTVAHPRAREVMAALTARGVIPDFRRPDGIRLGMAPLTTRFTDVYDGLRLMADSTS
ncbi:MAG: kynureninase [Nocardioidaceae bacterium]